jgi:chemotaxis protein CheD
MPYRIVDIADMKISSLVGDILVTYSLGSCVGVAVYDPVLQTGAMIHCMLPLSKVDKEKARERPYMFVDTGMQLMLNKLFDCGAQKSRLKIAVAGGAHVLNDDSIFKIGERNFTVLRKILWKNSMLMNVQDVGGDVSRTIRLHIGSGRFTVKSQGTEVHYDLPRKD